MNKLFTKIVGTCLGLAMAVGTGVAVSANSNPATRVDAASGTFSFTPTSKNTGTLTSAPSGVSATFVNTYNNAQQMTSGNSMTLTISTTGNTEYYITGITLSAKTNASKGAGSAAATIGGTTIGNYTYTVIGGTYTDKALTMTSAASTTRFSSSASLQVVISCTTNSVYCQKFTFAYTEYSSKTVSSLTTEPEDGETVNVNGGGSAIATSDLMYEVGYSDNTTGYSVDIASDPAANFSYEDDDAGTATLKFTKDGTYDVTVSADETHSATITYVVSNVVPVIYEKVTSEAQLKAGKEIIIGNTNGQYVLAPYVSGNNCPNVESTPDASGNLPLTNIGDGFAVFTLGGSVGEWTLTDQNDMVYFGQSGQNYLKASSNSTDTWSITIDSTSHEATITSAASSRWIAQNTSTKAFATYANSNQDEVAIYMLPSTDPAIEVSIDGSTSLGVGDTTTLTASKVNGATGTVQWTKSSNAVTLSATSGDSITVTGALDGEATVTASLTGCDSVPTVFTVTKALTGISVNTAPTKTAYTEGELFDKTGMVITASYDDGSSENPTDYTWSPNGALTPSDTVITISWGGKTTTQVITVAAKVVSSIAVKTLPTKHSYHSGDEFDSTGLEVTVTYEGGSTADITSGFTLSPSTYTFTDADENAGSKTFTVSYSGKSTTFDVTVAGITGPIDSGRYYIMNSAKTHGLNAVAATGSSPTALDLSVANNAMTAFDFELVADNEYEISVTISGTKYYLICTTTAASGSNTSIRVNTTECTWIMDDDGVETDGAYHLGQEKSSTTTRYLSCYNTTDWRGYVNTSNGDPEIQFVAEGSYAEAIANSLMNDITCNNGVTAPSTSSWSTIASNYSAITIAYEKALLVDGTANESSENVIEQALARYDYIVAKYGTSSYSNFLGRTISPISSSRIALSNVIGNNGTTVSIIVIVSLVSLTAIGGYFFIRKRKEQ